MGDDFLVHTGRLIVMRYFSYYISCAVLLGIPQISQTHAMNHGNYDEASDEWWSPVNLRHVLHVLPSGSRGGVYQDIKTELGDPVLQIQMTRMTWIDILIFSGAWRNFYAIFFFACSKTTAVNQGWLNHLIDFLSWNMVTTCWNWPVLVGVDDFFGAVPLASKMTRRDTSFAIPKLREEPT